MEQSPWGLELLPQLPLAGPGCVWGSTLGRTTEPPGGLLKRPSHLWPYPRPTERVSGEGPAHIFLKRTLADSPVWPGLRAAGILGCL